jgi:hypothetical protein
MSRISTCTRAGSGKHVPVEVAREEHRRAARGLELRAPEQERCARAPRALARVVEVRVQHRDALVCTREREAHGGRDADVRGVGVLGGLERGLAAVAVSRCAGRGGGRYDSQK